MAPLDLVATTAFGIEAVVVRELAAIGYIGKVTTPGRVHFAGDPTAICESNLHLRCAERVVIRLGQFTATDFGQLFDGTRDLPWETWIGPEAAFPVDGRSHKSQLSSVPACQRIVKKAICERLLAAHGVTELPETGPTVQVAVELIDDIATLVLDTSGPGLHKRGYRQLVAEGQIRETLAAAMLQLSVWNPDRPLLDPFCGTGTIAIEAARMARNIAPGIDRTFAAEDWPAVPRELWTQCRAAARARELPAIAERIIATDMSADSLRLARQHAVTARVEADVHFQQRRFEDLQSSREYGCLVTNPPYGLRVGTEPEVLDLYRQIPLVLRRLPTWSHYLITAREDFERLIGQPATRRRKLYNGRIRCTLYQFLGPKPPSMIRPRPAVPEASSPEPATDPPLPPPPPRRPAVPRTPAQPVFGGLPADVSRQATDFANRLQKLARHLRRWPTRRGITCYRIYDRDIPEIPLAIDRYDDALHIAEYARPNEHTVAQHADWLDHLVGVAADALEVARDRVFIKYRDRQRGTSQYERVGDSSFLLDVTEADLRFRVNLSDYIDTGLFLDHRLTRGMVRDAAAGKRVVNLFGYTGSFTVYAAAGGAKSTDTVDLSQTYLDWAHTNLQLNGLDLPAHRRHHADARDFLRAYPPGPHWDLAVVDPPTFSNSKRVEDDWDVQQHHVELLRLLADRMAAGGTIFFSTNFRRFRFDETALAPLACREISRHTVPEDFRNQRIHRAWRIEVPALR